MNAECPVCLRPSDGLLCSNAASRPPTEFCTQQLERELGDVAAIVADMDITLSRQARIGGGGQSGLARERMPFHPGVVDPIWVLGNVLTTWARDVCGDTLPPEEAVIYRNRETPMLGPFCGFCIHQTCMELRISEKVTKPPAVIAAWMLLSNTPAIRRHPAVEELLDEVLDAIRLARRTVDRAAERKFLGPCDGKFEGVTCTEDLYVHPAATEARCRVCGTEHDVAERREWLLSKAEDLIVTPQEASRYVGEVGGIPVGHQRIRNYLDRGRIPTRHSHDGVMRLRLGDLLEVLRDEAARHDARAS